MSIFRKIPDLRSMKPLEKITAALVVAGFLFLPIAVNLDGGSAPRAAEQSAVKQAAPAAASVHGKPAPPRPAHAVAKPKPKPKPKPRPKPKPKAVHRAARPSEGVDYSYSRPDLRQLRRAGKTFAVRYLTGESKALSHPEAHALRAAGLHVVSNYEMTTSDLTSGGFAHGVALARAAEAAHRANGGPAKAPIYFSADSSPDGWSHAQWHSFHQNLRGIASVIGVKRVGVYGGTLALETARSHGLARWYWQSLGWRNGQWLPWAHLQQHHIDTPMGGGMVDKNRALAGNYGQWNSGPR